MSNAISKVIDINPASSFITQLSGNAGERAVLIKRKGFFTFTLNTSGGKSKRWCAECRSQTSFLQLKFKHFHQLKHKHSNCFCSFRHLADCGEYLNPRENNRFKLFRIGPEFGLKKYSANFRYWNMLNSFCGQI